MKINYEHMNVRIHGKPHLYHRKKTKIKQILSNSYMFKEAKLYQPYDQHDLYNTHVLGVFT